MKLKNPEELLYSVLNGTVPFVLQWIRRSLCMTYAVVISIYEDYPRFAKVEDIYVADGKIVLK